jgi:hypothetical protein
MLPIFFLAFALVCQLQTTAAQPVPSRRPLDYYDADSKLDVNALKEWYDMVKTPLDEETSLQQLEKEALEANKIDSIDSVMYWYLGKAKTSKQCLKSYRDVSVPGVSEAECLAVVMYTLGDSPTPFYSQYNAASINKEWQPYKVYTTLLMSAIQKMTKIDPIPPERALYRGIKFTAERPNAERIFLKAFSSTSLDLKVAQEFAEPKGMILEFQPPHSRYAARVRKLSLLFYEEEVILPPFIAFDVLNVDGSNSDFKFKTSEVQKILPHIPQRKRFFGF